MEAASGASGPAMAFEDVLADLLEDAAQATRDQEEERKEGQRGDPGPKSKPAAAPTPRPPPAKRAKRNPNSTKNIVAALELPQCLDEINGKFQELALVVGFFSQQGVQPTLSGLQRLLPHAGDMGVLLSLLAAFAPGVITTKKVESRAQYSDASRGGKFGATHGALAEVGLNFTAAGDGEEATAGEAGTGQGSAVAPSPPPPPPLAETVVNLHVPCSGASPRVPTQRTADKQRLEWQTVTGGMVYGGLVFSDRSSAAKASDDGRTPSDSEAGGGLQDKGDGDGDGAALPSLIQGSRSSSRTIGPVGLSTIKSYQRGHMAQAAKQDVLRWQSYFRQVKSRQSPFRTLPSLSFSV